MTSDYYQHPESFYEGSYSTSSTQEGTLPDESLIVPRTWFLKDVVFYPSRVLGKGSYGIVCLGEWLGCPVAVKRLHEMFFHSSASEEDKQGVLKAFAHEVNILFKLKHPNIVSFYGVHDASGHGQLSLMSDTCLVQELLCMSLNSRNRQKPHLSYRNVLDLSVGITGGLRYLHERNQPIVHGDLSSKNILLTISGTPKIADLGVAKVINSTQHRYIEHSCQPGTELYMPPEAKLKGSSFDYRMDIYSLGVIILEICIARDPAATEAFRVMDDKGLQAVPEIERRRNDLQDLVDSPLYHLILACLTRKEDRPDTLRVHEKLRDLKTESAYTALPDTPVIQHSDSVGGGGGGGEGEGTHSCHRTELEEKIQLLQKEKELMLNHKDISAEQTIDLQSKKERIHHLEAIVRSRDNEIASLRNRNISLEEEVGKKSPLENSFPVRLTSRGELFNKVASPESENGLASELKAVKKQLDRYKDLTVELDTKLKDAKLELSKYSHLQSGCDIHGQYELNSFRAENRLLRTEVERLHRETTHYQHQLAQYRSYNSRY